MSLFSRNIFVVAWAVFILTWVPRNVSAQDVACPFPDERILLSPDLSMRAVRDPVNDALHVELTSSLGGWIGFAFSETSTMAGNVAAVGEIGLEPAWYDLSPSVVRRESETLPDATMQVTDAGSVFTFSIPLSAENRGSEVGYIYAAGTSDTIEYHTLRGFEVSTFVTCPSEPIEGSTVAPSKAPEELAPPPPGVEVPTVSPVAATPPTETAGPVVAAPTPPSPVAADPTSSAHLNWDKMKFLALSLVALWLL